MSLAVAPRTVIGYHGCSRAIADAILAADAFRPSENRYDWLGRGAYFWEYAPYRALEWAKLVTSTTDDEPAVLAVTIRLGRCVNLMDVRHHNDLRAVYEGVAAVLGGGLPVNTAGGAHRLDRLIVDAFCDNAARDGNPPDTVRGTFPEGEPIYPGSKILSLTHTQIAVRNLACVTRIRLVTFSVERKR